MFLTGISCDSLKYIISFLDNKTIINILSLSRLINKRLHHKKNLFTSIAVYPSDDLMEMYRHYINHSSSIQHVFLYRMTDPYVMWPFHEKNTSYIGCYNISNKRYNEGNRGNEGDGGYGGDKHKDTKGKKRVCIIKQHT